MKRNISDTYVKKSLNRTGRKTYVYNTLGKLTFYTEDKNYSYQMMPIVSIITPNYNRADFINETAESIFNQTYPYWEWMIVDDGSTDNSWELMESYAAKDNRVRIFRRQGQQKGACVCRNQAVDNCTGKYVIFLDSDDVLAPFCLENRVKTMEQYPGLDFAIYPALLFRHHPHDLNLWWNIDKPESELIRQFHQDAICQGTGVLFTKESFNRLGQWDVSLLLWQDIDLFFRAYIEGYKYRKFFDLPPDLYIRRLETSLSRSDFFNIGKQKSRVIVVKRAVQLLKENNMHSLLREARYMTAEIISGFIRSRYFDEASALIAWGAGEGVLNAAEVSSLKKLKYIYLFRLYKLASFRNLSDKIHQQFHCSRTLGTLTYKMQNEQPV